MLLQVLLDSLNLAVYSSTSGVPFTLSHFSCRPNNVLRKRKREREREGERFVSIESIQCHPLGPFHYVYPLATQEYE